MIRGGRRQKQQPRISNSQSRPPSRPRREAGVGSVGKCPMMKGTARRTEVPTSSAFPLRSSGATGDKTAYYEGQANSATANPPRPTGTPPTFALRGYGGQAKEGISLVWGREALSPQLTTSSPNIARVSCNVRPEGFDAPRFTGLAQDWPFGASKG
jgi:hypothetical protein